MPCTFIFDQQSESYRESVLPSFCRKRMAIEAGVTDYWKKYIGLDGVALGVDTFGESAPGKTVFELFGLTEKNMKLQLNNLLTKRE